MAGVPREQLGIVALAVCVVKLQVAYLQNFTGRPRIADRDREGCGREQRQPRWLDRDRRPVIRSLYDDERRAMNVAGRLQCVAAVRATVVNDLSDMGEHFQMMRATRQQRDLDVWGS